MIRGWLGCAAMLPALAACGEPPAGAVDARATVVDAAIADGAAPDAVPPDAAAVDAAPPLADLLVNASRASIDLAIHTRTFSASACELDPDEACIGGPGERRLLRFSIETPNVGEADLFLGAPAPENPQFAYSSCHDHYHFVDYANYQLLDGANQPIAAGHKQAFCLLDSEPYLNGDPTVATTMKYHCGWQGIQRGWVDVYHARLPCQWIDITDTPAGAYTLRIAVNENGALPESNLANNVIEIPVVLGDPDLETPTETCPLAPLRDLDNISRECGWDDAGLLSCTPGKVVRVGCSDCGGLGTCTGNPMMRVCDPNQGNCSFGAAIGLSDDECNACPRVSNLQCPPSGKVAVFTAAKIPGQPYSCVPILAEQ